MQTLLNISFMIICFTAGCKDKGVDPPPPVTVEKKWETVPEFINLDIRYMIHFKDELYAAVVNYQGDTLYKGAVLKTSDGNSWRLVKTFNEKIGPMTVEEDSLYVLSDYFIHKMNANGEWVIKFGLPWQITLAEYNGDMIFFNNHLYVTQTIFTGYMFKVSSDRVWTRIYPFGPYNENGLGGAKFIKLKNNNIEKLYLRDAATDGYLIHFDGELATFLQDGLPNPFKEANSIAVHNDTLLAGFMGINTGSSGMIMYLDNNNVWKLYKDSLPNSKSAFNAQPPFITLPTVLLCVGERMFVATDVYGVLEWKPDGGWQKIHKGLMLDQFEPKENELYRTISFLEYFRGNLFVGYGNPAYMIGTWVNGPRKGLLKYKIE